MKGKRTNLILTLVLTLNLTIFAQSGFADSSNALAPNSEQSEENPQQTPYISMNVDIQVNGLEDAAVQAAEGLELIGSSLRNIADHQELSPEHQKQISQSLSHMDKLSQSLALAVDQMPITVEKSLAPVIEVSNQLSEEIKNIIIIASIVLILIILSALMALYYFVLAPGAQSIVKTTRLLGELADTLKTTADIVEISSERNLQVMEEVRKTHQLEKA